VLVMAKTANPSEWTVEYERLRDLGTEKVEAGHFAEALEWFEAAFQIAEKTGDRNTIDLAFCNRAVVSVSCHKKSAEWVPRLQEILLRTSEPRVARFCAYNLSLIYDWEKSFKKSLFYGRIALRYSAELDQPELRASAYDAIGNALIAMNDFEHGAQEFNRALETLSDDVRTRRAVIEGNLGYTYLMLDRTEEALPLLYRSLRHLRRHASAFVCMTPELSLAFGLLLVDKYSKAIDHALIALESGEEFGVTEVVKNALLVIGEAYKRAGDSPAARRCFDVLQETYYPDKPEVPAMLLGLDLCKVINLRA
jgi:tetratricopeptide (TPR) repeat protein